LRREYAQKIFLHSPQKEHISAPPPHRINETERADWNTARGGVDHFPDPAKRRQVNNNSLVREGVVSF
jgi:hypothetical protein